MTQVSLPARSESPVPVPPQKAEGAADHKIPQAACDREIPATQCLAWHIAGTIPSAKMSPSGRSCRLLCANHPDARPSLTISIGDDAPLVWHCHVCGKDKRLEVRAALIHAYDLNPKCLLMTKQERAELEQLVDAVFATDYAHCTKLVCIRALHDGMRGALPKAPALIRLGERAGVSRRASFRAADELAGVHLDHLYVPKASEPVNDPKVASAFRGSGSVPDWHPVPGRHQDECQIGTEASHEPAA